MSMNILEVAVYAMVLTAGQPNAYECVAVMPEGVNCTNGLAAKNDGPNLLFSSGVQVRKDRQGRVTLSNGWVAFEDGEGKTVVSVRKTGPMRFKFSNGYQCEAMGNPEDMARCYRP
jgi:hypothetical protein